MKKSTFKPYQLVYVSEPNVDVQSGMHRYVGEVLSFVTPDDTIMVRRVPGFPGSLVELPIGYLQPCTWSKPCVNVAAVEGKGYFPMDMLRYDSCVPVNFDIADGRAVLVEGGSVMNCWWPAPLNGPPSKRSPQSAGRHSCGACGTLVRSASNRCTRSRTHASTKRKIKA